jgi:voltage-gated potassium channel
MTARSRVPPSHRELKTIGYELFVAGLSILSFVNIILWLLGPAPPINSVLVIIDFLLSAIFLVDFLYRLFTAEAKGRYFFRNYGWADLLACVPLVYFKIFRIFRLISVSRLSRKYGGQRLLKEFVANRAGSALLSLFFMIILVLEFGAMGEIWAEQGDPNANIRTGGEALWWVYVTITTVGYGDFYPVTGPGRIVGVVVLTGGVALFGVLTGYIANSFLERRKSRKPSSRSLAASDPREQVAELVELAAAQREAQAALEAKIAELQHALAPGKISGGRPV